MTPWWNTVKTEKAYSNPESTHRRTVQGEQASAKSSEKSENQQEGTGGRDSVRSCARMKQLGATAESVIKALEPSELEVREGAWVGSLFMSSSKSSF